MLSWIDYVIKIDGKLSTESFILDALFLRRKQYQNTCDQ